MKVLFLDDMELRHKKAIRVLIGHAVTSVKDADEAMEAMRKERFDVVCLDHDLREQDYTEHLTGVPPTDFTGTGTQVANFMATEMPVENRPIQVILHSCNQYARDRMESILRNAGFSFVQQKPFTMW